MSKSHDTKKDKKKPGKKDKKKNYHVVERFVGKFYREFPLPAGAEPDKISASSAKGVITVTIPSAAVVPIYGSPVLTNFSLLLAYLLIVFTRFAPIALAELVVTPLS